MIGFTYRDYKSTHQDEGKAVQEPTYSTTGTAAFLLLFGGKGCIARYPIIVAEEPCGGELCGAFGASAKRSI